MMLETFIISGSHPSLPGHFPGNPIIPGVVTLDQIARGLLKQIPGVSLEGFPQVKFLNPLLAEVTATVTYTLKKNMLYQFSCEGRDKIFLTGQMQLVLQEMRTNG